MLTPTYLFSLMILPAIALLAVSFIVAIVESTFESTKT